MCQNMHRTRINGVTGRAEAVVTCRHCGRPAESALTLSDRLYCDECETEIREGQDRLAASVVKPASTGLGDFTPNPRDDPLGYAAWREKAFSNTPGPHR